MPDGPHETPYGEPLRQPPERELVRTLPVIFILSTITTLYTIYVCAHLLPMLQLFEPPGSVDTELQYDGIVQAIIFNVLTLLLVSSYLMCILVHPGEVPNEAPWLYSAYSSFNPMLQEAKKTGERRHCKWCGKYKPDRCHHCRVCKTCVLKMDHHCPWIYNCVGYHNYKYFFLLLFYSALDTNFILWTMVDSMIRAIDDNAPFLQMFFILFGLTLAFFLGTLVTLFFFFHLWLTAMGLTTIEFCEKKFPKKNESQERNSGCLGDCFENESPFNLGIVKNLCMVLGYNPLFWCLPFVGSPGDGLEYETNDQGPSRGFETNRGAKKKGGDDSKKLLQAQHDASLAAGDMLQSYGLHGYGTLFQPANTNRPSRGSRGSFGGKGGGAIWGGR